MGTKQKEHLAKLNANQKKENNRNWNGGKYKFRGYIMIRKPEHPKQYYKGYVPEQILVMEEHLGRNLTKEECVHHINGKRDDNRIVNLRLFNAIENGQNNKNVKLTKKIAEKIREEYAQENTSYRKLGRKYHVSYGPILQIIKQKIWK